MSHKPYTLMEPTSLRGSLPSVLHLSRALCCSWLSSLSSKAALRKSMQPPISLCETGSQSSFQFRLSTHGTKDVTTKRLTVLNWEIVWVCVCVSLCVNFSLHHYRLSSCKLEGCFFLFREKYLKCIFNN